MKGVSCLAVKNHLHLSARIDNKELGVSMSHKFCAIYHSLLVTATYMYKCYIFNVLYVHLYRLSQSPVLVTKSPAQYQGKHIKCIFQTFCAEFWHFCWKSFLDISHIVWLNWLRSTLTIN